MQKEKRNRIIKLSILGFFIIFILIQLVPVDRTNAPVKNEPRWDSEQTKLYAERACFDCHSNQTKWPGYSYVAPVSWFVADHVHEGREHLNFSEWKYSKKKAKKIIEDIREGDMPLDSYLLLHSEARLTEQEKQEFISGMQKTLELSSEAAESR